MGGVEYVCRQGRLIEDGLYLCSYGEAIVRARKVIPGQLLWGSVSNLSKPTGSPGCSVLESYFDLSLGSSKMGADIAYVLQGRILRTPLFVVVLPMPGTELAPCITQGSAILSYIHNLCFLGEALPCYVVQAGLELAVFLPQIEC